MVKKVKSPPSPEKKISRFIGWEEWCAFPDLNLPAIKSKTDTGAKTSCLHADDIEPFEKNGEQFVRFAVHPIQKNRVITQMCEAKVKDYRYVTSSNGERDKRYVIETQFKIGDHIFVSDITLTSRYGMRFRMLLGKDSIATGKFLVNVKKTFIQGKVKEAKNLYLPK